MKNTKFFIKTHERKYPIYIGISSISTAKNKLKSITKNSKNIAFFLDTKIVPNRIKEIIHSLKGKKISIFKITANEKNKNFVIANNLLNGLAKKSTAVFLCLMKLFLKQLSLILTFNLAHLYQVNFFLQDIPKMLHQQLKQSYNY